MRNVFGHWLASYQIFNQHKLFDLVLTDVHLPGDMDGVEVAKQIHRINPSQLILFTTGDQKIETAQTLLATGLCGGFVPKNRDAVGMKQMLEPVFAALDKYRRYLAFNDKNSDDPVLFKSTDNKVKIIGKSALMKSAVRLSQDFIRCNQPVLVQGESGTGKELIAQAHQRPGQKFFAVNCGKYQINPQFVETELFGSVKGAFTGAENRAGIFENAGDGVVFLDEIDKLPVAAQGALLRVLEDGIVRRLGETFDRNIKASFRLVTAGKNDMQESTRSGAFLKDLYYRIAVLRIRVPSLRDRPEDIEPIGEYFLKKVCDAENLGRKVIRNGTYRLMEGYTWPGNLRELRNAVNRMAITTRSDVIEPGDFVQFLVDEQEDVAAQDKPLSSIKHKAFLLLKETEYFQELLSQSENQIEAARLAGLPRSTFNNKIKRLNIDPNQYLKEVKK